MEVGSLSDILAKFTKHKIMSSILCIWASCLLKIKLIYSALIYTKAGLIIPSRSEKVIFLHRYSTFSRADYQLCDPFYLSQRLTCFVEFRLWWLRSPQGLNPARLRSLRNLRVVSDRKKRVLTDPWIIFPQHRISLNAFSVGVELSWGLTGALWTQAP